MQHTKQAWLAIAVGAFLAAPLGSAQTAQANANQGRDGVKTLFTMTNDADRNQVVALVSEDGVAFREVHRFDTGGRGSGADGRHQPLQDQGSLTLSQDRSLLFAVNAGSGELSVFRVFGDDLILVNKVTTGGAEPVSVAQRGNLVYVLNQGGFGNITGYSLNRNGGLQRIPGAIGTLSCILVAGSQIGISPDGRFLVVTEQATPPGSATPNVTLIDTYAIHADGTLGPRVSTPSAGVGSFDFSFAPGGQLLVNNPGSLTLEPPTFGSGVSSYNILPNGTLSTITQYAATIGIAPCWSVVSADGKRLYVANTVTSNVSGFLIGSDGALTPLDSTVLAADPANSLSADLALSSDGKFLYNFNPGSNTIGVFNVNADGTLTAQNPIELNGGTGFEGLVAL